MEEKEIQKEKIHYQWLDIAKGITIISMIAGHMFFGDSKIRCLIFSFHMPLFFILAGYTIRPLEWNFIGKAEKKDFMRLVVPVFAVLAVEFFLYIFYRGIGIAESIREILFRLLWGNGNNYRIFKGIGPVWFLLSLFYAKFLYRIVLLKVKNGRTVFVCFVSLAAIMAGRAIRLPQSLDVSAACLVFMEAGYLLKNSEVKERFLDAAACILFCVWIFVSGCNGVFVELAIRHYPFYIGGILSALCASAAIIQFCKSLENFKCSRLLSIAGIHSLEILCVHQLNGYFLGAEIKILGLENFIGSSSAKGALFRVAVELALSAAVVFAWKLVKKLLPGRNKVS